MTSWIQVKDNAASELASAITAEALSLLLKTGEGGRFPASYPFYVTIEDEILKVTARSNDILTVVRAQENTTAAAHNAGAAVRLNLISKIITQVQSEIDLKQENVLTAKGDLLTRTATTLTRLSAGGNGQFLKADSSQPAGLVWATLSGFAVMASGSYTGNDAANRAVAHGLGVIPRVVIIFRGETSGKNSVAFLHPGYNTVFALMWDTSASYVIAYREYTVTVIDSTNFYVGNANDYEQTMNKSGYAYKWVALG